MAVALRDNNLKEVNEIIDYTETHFYINIADKEQMQEIIDQFKTERKEQIEAWNKEQEQRNTKK